MNLRRFIPIRRFREPPPVVAVVRLDGAIGRFGVLRKGLTLAALEKQFAQAFSLRHLSAVALAVNSPGGSAVQAAQIFTRIRALADEKEVPVFAFAEDVAGSGGYWLALAGDEIYADASSIVGSVGVLFQSFGFTDAIARLGIERRVHTAGTRKGALDAFRPENPEDVEMLKNIQSDVHDAFKDLVRARRGDKLNGSEDEMFSGAFWSGKRAVELGLIDGLGDLRGVMRERFGDRVRLKQIEAHRGWLRGRLGVGAADPVAIGEGAIAAVEERLLWSRYGL
ncbi:MAG TPA: S49 family peptidase [Alphaproteobacteria bacterium]|nr:S49 family peptidase [Alphaproteobacteria bacterium]